MSDADIVLRNERDGVMILTLNRPERMNALSAAMSRALDKAIAECVEQGTSRCILITGAGRGFCAGADLTERLPVPDGSSVLETYYHPTLRRMRDCPLPVVAAVNGVAAGAGMSLALMADIVTCAADAYFLQAFVRAGLVPDCGASWLLAHRIGQARAREMSMLAERLPADKALDWGLVNHVFEGKRLFEESLVMARRLADGPANALGRVRHLYNAVPGNDFEAQLDLEDRLQQQCSGSPEALEGRQAFLDKRGPNFTTIPRVTNPT